MLAPPLRHLDHQPSYRYRVEINCKNKKKKQQKKQNMFLLELFYCFSLQLCVVSILKTIEIDMLNNCMKEQPVILEVKLRQF